MRCTLHLVDVLCKGVNVFDFDLEFLIYYTGTMAHIRTGIILLAIAHAACEPVRIEHSVVLMGTPAQFVVEASDREQGLALLEHMVTTIEDVEAEISTWRDSTVFGRVNNLPIGQPMQLPVRSCKWIEQVANWWRESGGAFNPAVGQLTEAWGLRGSGHHPTTSRLDSILLHGGFNSIRFDAGSCQITRLADVSLDAGGFGKGAALDEVHLSLAGVKNAWMINFGGQVAVRHRVWPMSLAHPLRRDEPILDIQLGEGSLATSGGSEHNLILDNGSQIGHILNPHTGLPVQWTGSVTVWSMSALDADILSTSLYVMGPQEGFDWAVQRQIAACFLVHDPGGEMKVKLTPEFKARFWGRDSVQVRTTSQENYE